MPPPTHIALPAGVAAAVAAGIPAVGILSGQEPGVLLAAGACALVPDFRALVAAAARDCGGEAAAGGGSRQQAPVVGAAAGLTSGL
jgi:hypothetical protein